MYIYIYISCICIYIYTYVQYIYIHMYIVILGQQSNLPTKAYYPGLTVVEYFGIYWNQLASSWNLFSATWLCHDVRRVPRGSNSHSKLQGRWPALQTKRWVWCLDTHWGNSTSSLSTDELRKFPRPFQQKSGYRRVDFYVFDHDVTISYHDDTGEHQTSLSKHSITELWLPWTFCCEIPRKMKRGYEQHDFLLGVCNCLSISCWCLLNFTILWVTESPLCAMFPRKQLDDDPSNHTFFPKMGWCFPENTIYHPSYPIVSWLNYGGFHPNMGTPWIIHFQRTFHDKPSWSTPMTMDLPKWGISPEKVHDLQPWRARRPAGRGRGPAARALPPPEESAMEAPVEAPVEAPRLEVETRSEVCNCCSSQWMQLGCNLDANLFLDVDVFWVVLCGYLFLVVLSRPI